MNFSTLHCDLEKRLFPLFQLSSLIEKCPLVLLCIFSVDAQTFLLICHFNKNLMSLPPYHVWIYFLVS